MRELQSDGPLHVANWQEGELNPTRSLIYREIQQKRSFFLRAIDRQ